MAPAGLRYTPPAGVKGKRQKNPPRTVNLPFLDDFFYSSSRPNPALWQDDYTYINYTFPSNPPSAGVATFDGLRPNGRPYVQGFMGAIGRSLDTLTSQFIDLKNNTVADSLYLSFFYQGGGLSDDGPDRTDSLILEFKCDSILRGNNKYDTAVWIKVWSSPGFSSKEFSHVLIPVKDTSNSLNYFHQRFQFRFRAISNPSGLLDVWHIDYVYLNRGRTFDDTVLNDVAMAYPSGSILKNYYTMPYNQFRADSAEQLAPMVNIYVRNNFYQPRNVDYGYRIHDYDSKELLSAAFATVAANVEPHSTANLKLSRNPINLNQPTKPIVRWKIKTYGFNAASTFLRSNDSIDFIQYFHNYFAYDDGSAESVYYLGGTPRMRAAVRFSIPKPDSLYGVAIHFAEQMAGISNEELTVAVWKKINGVGKPAFEQPDGYVSVVRQKYYDSMNGFVYYELPKPIAIETEVYAGWIQNRDFQANVGFDKNYVNLSGDKANPNLFFSVDGTWEATALKGAPMIRLYTGSKPDFSHVRREIPGGKPMRVTVSPNPASSSIKLMGLHSAVRKYSVFNQLGQPVILGEYLAPGMELSVESLPPGMYIIRGTTMLNEEVQARFIKQ